MSDPTNKSPREPESTTSGMEGEERSLVGSLIDLALRQRLIVVLVTLFFVGWGLSAAPFDWSIGRLPRSPVPVDAIPDLGENQQIVFAEWPGRSPRDVEDQLTYPLTVQLLGVPRVREVRSQSMFGFSSVFVIFEDGVDFYWARARVVERLASMPMGALPEGVQPRLGPDATGLGQIFWYTLEGRDPDGEPAGGWDLHTLRSVQDYTVRYALQAAEGISEVASVGGHVMEYQVDVDPDALRAFGAGLSEVVDAVRKSNLDVGARTTEINRVEYVVRGVGFVRSIEDIEEAVVRSGPDLVPVRVKDLARVTLGPATRRGALTKEGAEAVGGVVTVRHGYNPLAAIQNVKEAIDRISAGLPARALVDWEVVGRAEVARFAEERGIQPFDGAGLNHEDWVGWLQAHPRDTWPEWLTMSRLTIEPFYDRTGLIQETLGTLEDALLQQLLVTILVVLLMVFHLRGGIVVSSMLPLAVLMAFIAMKLIGIEANVVSLAGIAIAIGAIVDMGIIVVENVLRHNEEQGAGARRLAVVSRATREVGPAVVTAIATTVISFLPVFTMTGAEGKLFVPLAVTKTAVMVAAVLLALTVVPAAALLLVGSKAARPGGLRRKLRAALGVVGAILFVISLVTGWELVALAAGGAALASALSHGLPILSRWLAGRSSRSDETRPAHPVGLARVRSAAVLESASRYSGPLVASLIVAVVLASLWQPLGPGHGTGKNLLFVILLAGSLIGVFKLVLAAYEPILRWCLAHKAVFLAIPVLLVSMGATVVVGFDKMMSPVKKAAAAFGVDAEVLGASAPWSAAARAFPGLPREFMPALDEGSFLWMPTTMPHASFGEALEILSKQDLLIASVPEVASVVGKIGRAETALDPAPVSMIETVIDYYPEYVSDASGRPVTFAYDRRAGEFLRDENGELIEDRRGRPYRQWRDHIRSPDDIWKEIAAAAHIPGATSAPKLQPIETRLVMLQTGMRAPMGIKVRGPDLESIESTALRIEEILRESPSVEPATVSADRVVGKPYLEIHVDRASAARHGLGVAEVQDFIATAIGGRTVTTTVEGRERYGVRVRLARELRDLPSEMERLALQSPLGHQALLTELAHIEYVRGPQMIRTENAFPVAYVTFGAASGRTEVDVIEEVRGLLSETLARGELVLPAGVSFEPAGTYEHQVRATRTLLVVLPVALVLIFTLLYLQFRSTITTGIVFAGIFVAWGGGFVAIWLFGQEWFASFDVFGVNLREVFNLQAVSLSVAVWVGFLALFGIAVDDGVVMATYLDQRFRARRPKTIEAVREATIEAGMRRARPCLMTTATTVLALMPVLTSTGRGSDIMIPMALPTIGGMGFVVFTMFTVPVLYALFAERRVKRGGEALPTEEELR